MLWPLFPGISISELLQAYTASAWLKGFTGPFLFTALFLGLSISSALRFKRSLWPILAVVFLISFALVRVILALLRA